MQLDEKDKGYLWDIEDACKDILHFLKNTTHHEFINDKMKRFAVERQLLVIGEAAQIFVERLGFTLLDSLKSLIKNTLKSQKF